MDSIQKDQIFWYPPTSEFKLPTTVKVVKVDFLGIHFEIDSAILVEDINTFNEPKKLFLTYVGALQYGIAKTKEAITKLIDQEVINDELLNLEIDYLLRQNKALKNLTLLK